VGEVTVTQGESLDTVHELLKKEIVEICNALSLCHRRPVNFYEVEYIANADERNSSKAFLRRRWQSAN
jgi:hypothetical protein